MLLQGEVHQLPVHAVTLGKDQIPTELFVCKVKVTQILPQRPVLTEDVQRRRGLSQVNDVMGIRKVGEDLIMHELRQVVE